MVACIPAAIWVTNTQSAKLGNARARCERVQHADHKVVIRNDQVIPKHTYANKCDTLTIINEDRRSRIIAFGPHDHHISYDGVSESRLAFGQSFAVTLITPGTFVFHDHADYPLVEGAFSVTNQSLPRP